MSSKMLNVLLRNVAASLLLLLGSVTAQAAESGFPLDHMEPDIHDQASLQRGMQDRKSVV